MSKCSLLQFTCSMILITTVVVVSPAGLAKTTRREPQAPRTANPATRTTAVSRCRLVSAHRCLPTISGDV